MASTLSAPRDSGQYREAPAELRMLFASQAKLLAARAEAGLRLDAHSLRNLLSVFREISESECRLADELRES